MAYAMNARRLPCHATRASGLAALAVLTTALLQTATAASFFEPYTNWTRSCGFSGSLNSSCQSSATVILDFTYAVVQGKTSKSPVGTAELTTACRTCSGAIDAALATVLPTSDPATCPLLPSREQAALTATALRRFVCWGSNTGGGSNSSSATNAAGSCVVEVVAALDKAGVLDAVRRLDGSLRFTGSTLRSVCAALVPPPGQEGANSCCGRSWAYLMAGIAAQSCLPELARELIALPGRCEVLLDRPVPGFCEADWAVFLMPLLTPLPSSRCSLASSLGASAAAAAALDGGVVPAWTRGSACSTDQLQRLRCPTTTCDLWCGAVGRMQELERAPPPPPAILQGDSSGLPASPSSSSGGGGLHVATIVIVCVFSVLIAALLVALAFWFRAVQKEKKEGERETFAFDNTLAVSGPTPGATRAGSAKSFISSKLAPAQTAPASLAAGRISGGGASGISTHSAGAPPTTPLMPRGSPLPASATAAAAAGGITRTPRYQPGAPPGQPLSPSQPSRLRLGSASGSGHPAVSSDPSSVSLEIAGGSNCEPVLAMTLAAQSGGGAAAAAASDAAATGSAAPPRPPVARALDFSTAAAATATVSAAPADPESAAAAVLASAALASAVGSSTPGGIGGIGGGGSGGGGGGAGSVSTRYYSATSHSMTQLSTPSGQTVYMTPAGSDMTPGNSDRSDRELSVAALDRLRSHRVSMTSTMSGETAGEQSMGQSHDYMPPPHVGAQVAAPEVAVSLADVGSARLTPYGIIRSHYIQTPATGSLSTSTGGGSGSSGSAGGAPGSSAAPSVGGAAPSRLHVSSSAASPPTTAAVRSMAGSERGSVATGASEEEDPVRMPLPSVLTGALVATAAAAITAGASGPASASPLPPMATAPGPEPAALAPSAPPPSDGSATPVEEEAAPENA